MVGHRIDLTGGGGGPCTVLIVREVGGDGWVLYPHGVAGLAVELSGADAEALACGILGTTGSGW